MRFMASDSPSASLVREWRRYGLHASRYLPLSLRPLLIGSAITAGVAVGWHRAPSSVELPPMMGRYDNRFLMGQLIHAAKEYDELSWATDIEDVHTIGHLAACALTSTNFARRVDLIAAVPSSRGTNSLPYQIAKDVGFLTRIRYAPAESIVFRRHIPQVKEINAYWEKRDLLHGSMTASPGTFRGSNLLFVDDVCRSGATFHEAARASIEAGAASVAVLAVSKTFEFQRIPERPSSRTAHQVNPEAITIHEPT